MTSAKANLNPALIYAELAQIMGKAAQSAQIIPDFGLIDAQFALDASALRGYPATKITLAESCDDSAGRADPHPNPVSDYCADLPCHHAQLCGSGDFFDCR
jgi:hypothetical protein